MAFRRLDTTAPFNSASSAKLLEFYESHLLDKITRRAAKPSHKTFAASSFRCDRRSWFRLRGVQPDRLDTPDITLDFAASLGTACHEIIQSNLKEFLGDDWIDVDSYLKSIDFPYQYEVKTSANGLETQVEIIDPPIRFSCDGIIRWEGELWLLEIKTEEYSAWKSLTDSRPEHNDQTGLYATLLKLNKILFIYVDRWYGGMKSYSISMTESQQKDIMARICYVLDMVDKNIAPEGLSKGDKWCSPNYCPYHSKCKEYGR